MKNKLFLIFVLVLFAGKVDAQWGGGGGSTFYWYRNGGTPTTDTLRFVQGTNATLTQSGKTLEIAVATSPTFTGTVTKLDLLDLAAGMWLNSPTTGTVDSTVAGIPMKMFSTSDTAFCDIFLPAHFSSLDSMVVLGGTISALGDSAAFSIQVKTVARRGAYVGAFNTAVIDSSDLGTANTQAFWKFTSFGAVTAFTTLRIKMWRSACTNNTGSDVYMERVILYGKGLR